MARYWAQTVSILVLTAMAVQPPGGPRLPISLTVTSFSLRRGIAGLSRHVREASYPFGHPALYPPPPATSDRSLQRVRCPLLDVKLAGALRAVTAPRCAALHAAALYGTALHNTALHGTVVTYTALHRISQHCAALQLTGLLCVYLPLLLAALAAQCRTLHCTAVHYNRLHCTTLDYTTLGPTSPHCRATGRTRPSRHSWTLKRKHICVNTAFLSMSFLCLGGETGNSWKERNYFQGVTK